MGSEQVRQDSDARVTQSWAQSTPGPASNDLGSCANIPVPSEDLGQWQL